MMVVHPHPLSLVQSPLVLVSPRICHPDEKSFRRLNRGRFSPGCPPPPPLAACLIGPGSPCSTLSNLGGATGAVGACACVSVCVMGEEAAVCGVHKKIYSCRE